MTTRAPDIASTTAGPATPKPAQSNGAATGLAVAGAIVTTITNFGIAILIARVSATLAGLFFTTTAVVTILGNSAGLGTMTGLVYFLPAALGGPRPNPRALLVLALRPVVVISAATALGLFLGAAPLAAAVAADEAAEATVMLRLLAFAIPFWAVTVTCLGATRGLGSMTPTVLVNQVVRPLGQLLLIGGVLLIDREPSGPAIAVAWSIPVVAAAAVAVTAVARLGGFGGRGPGCVSRREFWHYTRPRALSTAGQIALERIDVVLVSAFAGEAAAGVYGTITRFISAGNFLVFGMGQATSGGLRRALALGDHQRAQRLLRQSTAWMVLLAWPYFLLIATKAEPLAALLHPSFVSGATTLTVLAVAMLAGAFAGPVELTLLMLGRSRWSLASTSLALTLDLGVAWFAIPRFGIVGAAVAWGVAVVAQNSLASILVRQVGGLGAVARPSLIAASGALLAVVPIGLITPDDFGGLVTTSISAGAVLGIWVLLFAPVLDLEIGPLVRIRARLGN